MEQKFVCLVVLAIVGCAIAGPANFYNCDDVDTSACSVDSVDITPCNAPSECLVRRGANASIVFDYTPNFAADKLKTLVYSIQNSVDMEFTGMDTDGCKFTPCPAAAGAKQRLTYPLYLGRKLPKGHYHIKWALWNEENEAQKCCFTTRIFLK